VTSPEADPDAMILAQIRARHQRVLRRVGVFTAEDIERSPVAQLYVDRAWLLGYIDRLEARRPPRRSGDTRSGA
jgi:hypothetical protein